MATTTNNEARLLAAAAQIKKDFLPAEIAQLIRLIAPTPNTGEMSAEDFERLMANLASKGAGRGYSEKSLAAARQVLVMGANIPEAATEVGMTKQSVSQLMIRVRRHMKAVPEGWKSANLCLPSEICNHLEDVAEVMRKVAQAQDKSRENEELSEAIKDLSLSIYVGLNGWLPDPK